MGIISVTRENFDQLTRGDKPLLLEFQAPWCTYCRRLQGAVEEIAQQYEGQLVVGAMNIDDEEALSDSLGIELVPTLMLFQNGQVLSHVVNPPSKAAIESFLNQELPAPQQEDEHLYDMVVIGGGPAGYTAALYGARAGLDTLVLEKLSAGGQMAQTTQIDNYPGFEEGVDGFTLGMKLQAGAQRFGAQTLIAEVQSVQLDAPVKVLHTSQGVIRSRTVVIATGADHRSLGLEGEEALTGRGVSYCAACDGMFFKGKRVAVGPAASATENSCLDAFAVMDITAENTSLENLGLGDGADSVGDGIIDAAFGFAGLPIGGQLNLAATKDIVVLDYTQEEIDGILAGNEAYIQATIPAGTYTGQDYDTMTFGVKCLVIVSADMDESLVYDMCKAMNENSADLAAGNAILNEMQDPSFLCTNMPIPLHDGATKYYTEQGLL